MFIPSIGIDWPRRAFQLHYPSWLLWIDYALATFYLAVLATFLVLRGREVVSFRRQQQPGRWRALTDRFTSDRPGR